MGWSRSNMNNFRDHYRSKECLWEISSKEYKIRTLKKKNSAYLELVDYLISNNI